MIMANEGLNEMWIRADDIPNKDRTSSTNSYKPAIKGEAAASGAAIGHLEFNHSFSRIRALNCDNFLIA